MGQEQINRQGQKHIAGLAATVKQLWDKACEHDEIDPTASFVVRGEDNPYWRFYDIALTQYWEARRQYASGGYVGIRIKGK